MPVTGGFSKTPFQEFIVVQAWTDLAKGDVLKFTIPDAEFAATPATAPMTDGDGTSVVVCPPGKIPCGVAMEDAAKGDSFRMLIRGWCDRIHALASQGQPLMMDPYLSGCARGNWLEDLTEPVFVFGHAYEANDANGYITKAWVSF